MKSNHKIGKFINSNRAYALIIIMLAVGIFAKNFYTVFNLTAILNSTVLYTFIGIGFTICMIAAHMDLSVGIMANVGAVLVMGMHTYSKTGWFLAILIAVLAGLLFGMLNGLLITKAKIHSFITTLGMQFVLRGAMYIYCGGAEIGDKGDFALADFLNKSLAPLPLTPKMIFTLLVVVVFALILAYTRWGRNVYMIGGNPDTAWLAGIKRDAVTTAVFSISGGSCAIGGAIFAISQSSALPNLGEKGIPPLMVALAATIIGGTSTYGGSGSVFKTFIAVLGLMVMSSVLTALVGKYEIQILSIGVVLAACVLYETITSYYANKKIGIRNALVEQRQKELNAAN